MGKGQCGEQIQVIEAGFEPGRLTLARELKGWNQAKLAEELKVTAAAVSQFEGGVTTPSPKKLKAMSATLGVPSGFFSLNLVDTHEGFFRTLRRTSVVNRRKARAIAHVAHDIATLAPPGALNDFVQPAVKHPSLDASRAEIEALAVSVRLQWGLPLGPVRSMTALLEEHGVVVIRSPLDSTDVDAFSLPFPDHPVIVLSSDKNDRARSRFDAAHELGHLVLHGEQVWGLKEVEKQAHWFAAAFLMPEDQIAAELPSGADWPILFDLKRKWQVSLAALLIRCKDLRKISETSYLGGVKMMSARGWRRSEPVPLGPPEEPALLRSLLQKEGREQIGSVLPDEVVMSLVEAASGATN
jgi:Zn-dependent peptidase ImmA (M78 family)/transcriptional regulator with XRE-family HTH domain